MGRATLAIPRPWVPTHDRFLRAFASARPELLRSVLRLLGSPEDAQDAVQEAFLKCWRTRERLGEVHDLRAWIFRVALNAARDLRRNAYRQRARPLPAACECDPAVPCPTEHLCSREQHERLHEALLRLRPREREVFLLRQNSDLTYDEISRRCAIPAGTAKTLMRAALSKLRAVLHEK